MLKKILIVLFVVLVIIQFIRPAKNIHIVDASKQITTLFSTPDNVKVILQMSCTDCHSNNTDYPWYNNIQPVYWYLNNHINDGKKHLNFDEFGTYKLNRQYHKLEEIIEEVEQDEMPLNSYTLIHTDAKLNKEDKDALMNWAKACMDTMKNKYPMDSLITKKK